MTLEFKENNLWENDSSGFACNGNAKRLIEQTKRRFGVSGRIFEVFAGQEPAEFDASHSYVVLDNQADDELALNQPIGAQPITVVQAKTGADITAEIFKTPWRKLR